MRSYDGISPMIMLGTPISSNVIISIDLRPMRSPKWPNTMPPIGRPMKPTANVPNAASVPTTGSSDGKKMRLKTRAAAVP